MSEESLIRIRPAHPGDAEPLARLHLACSSVQPGGFMHRLGLKFFVEYYRILLKERTSVVLCADTGRDGIVGLISATVDSKRQLEAIRRQRFQLFWAAFPAVLRRPSLIGALAIRRWSLSARGPGKGFIVGAGARIVYWGWRPDFPSTGKSTCLLKELLRFMEARRVSGLQLEVDRVNRKVEVTHRLLGARIVKEFVTKDGRARIIMEYRLSPAASAVSIAGIPACRESSS